MPISWQLGNAHWVKTLWVTLNKIDSVKKIKGEIKKEKHMLKQHCHFLSLPKGQCND